MSGTAEPVLCIGVFAGEKRWRGSVYLVVVSCVKGKKKKKMK